MSLKITREKDVDIWFTSDIHFDHSNLCRGVTLWDADKMATTARDYDTLEEMNEGMVANINSKVKENDILFILGDMYFGSFRFGECVEAITDYLTRINGRKYMILGNHDEEDVMLKVAENEGTKIQAVENYMEMRSCAKVDGQLKKIKVAMMHYPILSWNGLNFKKTPAFMLHGHCHGTLTYPDVLQDFPIMDVGMDTNNLYPYSIEDVFDTLKDKKPSEYLDHHSP